MFNVNPVNPIRLNQELVCVAETNEIIESVIKKAREKKANRIILDGTHGVPFASFVEKLYEKLQEREYSPATVDTNAYLKSSDELHMQFRDNITDNRAFGYMVEGDISAYFKEDAKISYKKTVAPSGNFTIEYGTGSYWLNNDSKEDCLYIYLDISREKQQVLYKDGLSNFGDNASGDFVEKYKISFFVEWPILEKYRKETLKNFDYYIDFNQTEKPVMTSVSDLFAMAEDISNHPLRVKPFFAPGVWGGQFLKNLADLPEDWVNCAWSFEPIAPENSILIGCGDQVLEVPFLIIMDLAHQPILGDRIVGLFGDYFPIRFDYLDTMDGTNLSCQVHPKQSYIREKFNYPLEQQESYYMMEKKEGSKVYLGLTEDCSPTGFLQEVEHSQMSGEPIEFTKYVKEWDCEKGDLFLIPTGTVHCSGSDNLVLEISATTWWFTFKIYDYVRKDLDGKPRPINIDHAKENIDWYKKENWVKENLIQHPRLIQQQKENQEYVLGAREDLLFYVNRIHLHDCWRDDTNGEVMLLNLVEGDRISIRSTQNPDVQVELGYAESYIIPAVFGEFEIINIGTTPCKIIKAGVSPQWDVKILDE
ncbi:class I mannose-6-phosphate isomerase [Bacillus haimaensis]|uniref:class I mannose-6-phosphate isomerase n=1 Tax=Bacillus haimaensis TaxID=3160967 RepID=UPI003AA9AD50